MRVNDKIAINAYEHKETGQNTWALTGFDCLQSNLLFHFSHETTAGLMITSGQYCPWTAMALLVLGLRLFEAARWKFRQENEQRPCGRHGEDG